MEEEEEEAEEKNSRIKKIERKRKKESNVSYYVKAHIHSTLECYINS